MTPPGRAASPLDSLAPDQRAALELVVRQGRAYGELASLLGIPEAAVRARAHSALEALAPDLPPPPVAAELADFLLGQQDAPAAERTRARLADDAAAQRWVMTVAAPLGELEPAAARASESAAAGAAAAAGDLAAIEDIEVPAPRAAAAAGRPRPLRAQAEPGAAAPDEPAGRSSRLGGAILIGAAVVAVAAMLVFVLTRSGSHKPAASAATTPKPTATSAADQLRPTDVVLTGPAGSRAVGLMRLFTATDNNLHFLLAGQNLPPNRGKQHYALWFLKRGAPPRWLGFARFTVGKDGALAMTGPRTADLKRFPTWFTTYGTVQVTD